MVMVFFFSFCFISKIYFILVLRGLLIMCNVVKKFNLCNKINDDRDSQLLGKEKVRNIYAVKMEWLHISL